MTGEWVIWHNPRCSTSRFVLGALEGAGLPVAVRDYQKQPPDADELRAALAASGMDARGLLRRKSPVYEELALGNKSLSEDDLIAVMAARPEVIERPLVFAPDGRARMCRPKETVFQMLDEAGIRTGG